MERGLARAPVLARLLSDTFCCAKVLDTLLPCSFGLPVSLADDTELVSTATWFPLTWRIRWLWAMRQVVDVEDSATSLAAAPVFRWVCVQDGWQNLKIWPLFHRVSNMRTAQFVNLHENCQIRFALLSPAQIQVKHNDYNSTGSCGCPTNFHGCT